MITNEKKNLTDITQNYLKRMERFYNRKLNNFDKFLIRGYARELQKILGIDFNNPQLKKENDDFKNLPEFGKPIIYSKNDNKIKIAVITENISHLTGGRYYCWFIAVALQEIGCDVTVYTNRIPEFDEDFGEYQKPKIVVAGDRARDLETLDVKADIYIGSPISGNIAAAILGKKYNKPSFDLIFDPFPMMDKYMGKHGYAGWNHLIEIIKRTNVNIISLCNTTSQYIYDWLSKRKDQVYELYPCINSREANKANRLSKGDYVVFISRLVAHKNFDHVLKAVKDNGIKLKVISSVDGINAVRLVKEMGMTDQVEFLFKINDRQKFEVINGSLGVINGATFEGFGMWAIEALSCGVPVICYEYPTIKEIRDFAKSDIVYLAKWGNKSNLSKVLAQALSENRQAEPAVCFGFTGFMNNLRKILNIVPRIGVIMIALNEEEFIGASLRAVIRHPNVKRIAVVEGAVNLFAHAATDKGLSLDNTKEKILQVLQEENGDKIVYKRYGWASDKSELRNVGLSMIGNEVDYILVVDADEVWKQEDLDKLVKAIEENPRIGVFLFKFYHFWKKKNQITTGSMWDSSLFRCFKFEDKSYHWDRHEMPVVNSNGRFIHKILGQMMLEDVHVYHYGAMKSEKRILEKLEFYKKRDKNLEVKNTWSKWKPGRETQWTHGGGVVEKFKGKHPDEISGII